MASHAGGERGDGQVGANGGQAGQPEHRRLPGAGCALQLLHDLGHAAGYGRGRAQVLTAWPGHTRSLLSDVLPPDPTPSLSRPFSPQPWELTSCLSTSHAPHPLVSVPIVGVPDPTRSSQPVSSGPRSMGHKFPAPLPGTRGAHPSLLPSLGGWSLTRLSSVAPRATPWAAASGIDQAPWGLPHSLL